jgi:SPP1 gp7 family putative phage head morphogenesis protein
VPKEEWDYDIVREGIDEVKGFLKYPNKNIESFTTFLRAIIKDILEVDAGVVVKVYTLDSYDFEHLEPKSGAPLLKPVGQRKMVELYARDGASFLKETDKFGFIKGYWQYSYQIPAHPMWFNKEEICYFMRNQRSMSCYGYAPTQAIMDLIKSLHYSTLYNKRYFEETTIPDGVMSLIGTNETELKNFITQWNTEFKAQPHKLAVVNSEFKWQPLNVSQKELEFLETQSWYYKLIISMFGLTPAELGLTEDLNRATAATQTELTKRKGIRPLLKIIESYMNADIIPEFGYEGIEFSFIYDDPQEKTVKLDNWGKEIQLGLKSINEVRVEMGMEPVDWGEGQAGKFNITPYSPETAQSTTAQTEEEGIPEEASEGQATAQTEEDERRSEAETERKERTLDPYSDASRPVGSFRSAKLNLEKGKKIEMDTDDLIEEHKKLVQILETANPQELKDEADKQRKELENYMQEKQLTPISEYSGVNYAGKTDMSKDISREEREEIIRIVYDKLVKDIYLILQRTGMGAGEAARIANLLQQRGRLKSKGVNDGQYYREPFEVIKPSRGKIEQPQNKPKPMGAPSQFQDTGLETSNCPVCGFPTLHLITSADDLARSKVYHCNNCGVTLDEAEALDHSVLDTMFSQMMSNPYSGAITTPQWSPKSFDKKYDEITTKDYIGFDLSKSAQFMEGFVISKEYYKLLKKYLEDLNKDEVKTIIKILQEGISKNETISQIAKKLENVTKDLSRARLIARTETIRIANEGNRLRMEDKGIKKAEWISAPEDGRLCEECKKLDGKIFNLKFLKNKIPLHCNCRCSFTER